MPTRLLIRWPSWGPGLSQWSRDPRSLRWIEFERPEWWTFDPLAIVTLHTWLQIRPQRCGHLEHLHPSANYQPRSSDKVGRSQSGSNTYSSLYSSLIEVVRGIGSWKKQTDTLCSLVAYQASESQFLSWTSVVFRMHCTNCASAARRRFLFCLDRRRANWLRITCLSR